MRTFTSILLCISAVFVLVSCSMNPSADTLAYHMMKLYPKSPPCAQYVKAGVENEYGYLSPEDFFHLYRGQKEKLPEWDLIKDFRLILSDSSTPFELHIIRTYSSSDIDEIEKLLNKRAELIRYHNKTETSYLSYECSVFIRGRYAVLAVTEDNNLVKLLLKDLL